VTQAEVRKALAEMAEAGLRDFNAHIMPDAEKILGVRTAEIRKLAVQIVRGDWLAYLDTATPNCFEETLLMGMVIARAKADCEEILERVAWFLPRVHCWAVCDLFCGELKLSRQHPWRVWSFILPYLRSKEAYERRFASVMMLNYFVDDEHIAEVLSLLDTVDTDHLYVHIAVAWALSICYKKFPDLTRAKLRRSALDDLTINKAISKICESRALSPEAKAEARSLRRGGES